MSVVHGITVLRGITVATALLATAASTLRVYPHQLAYFNELAGGPENGHQHLLGSNLDWGQDLLFLREWLCRNRSSVQDGFYLDCDTSLAFHLLDLESTGRGMSSHDGSGEVDVEPMIPRFFIVDVNRLVENTRGISGACTVDFVGRTIHVLRVRLPPRRGQRVLLCREI